MTWEDIQGYYDWDRYYESVVDSHPSGTLVEVGCYLGRSLCHLGQLVKDSGKPLRVVGVDWCLGSGVENGHDHHHQALKRGGGTFAGELWGNVVACGLQDVVSVIVGESSRVCPLFADESLTMVFLDACHDYASISRDIRLWHPKVTHGGELAGDDYGDKEPRVFPDVKRAVDELLPGACLVPHDCWAIRKLGELPWSM